MVGDAPSAFRKPPAQLLLSTLAWRTNILCTTYRRVCKGCKRRHMWVMSPPLWTCAGRRSTTIHPLGALCQAREALHVSSPVPSSVNHRQRKEPSGALANRPGF